MKTRYIVNKHEKARQKINKEEKTREVGMTVHSTVTTLHYYLITFRWGHSLLGLYCHTQSLSCL
jgi:hypothetical protein